MNVIELSIPGYTVDIEPDYRATGSVIDDAIKMHFMGQKILLRGAGSQQHQDKSVNELIEVIISTGTDRYDPERHGDRYENVANKLIDLFAFSAVVTKELKLGWQVIYGFYHSAIGAHGYPVKIDILTIYDAHQLDEVVHQYAGRDDIKRDGFVFKNPENKPAAVLGIIQIN
ncbi:MAG: hypothetical protein KIH63_003540 [Candidatus Saccharibacteria bacterium]|nr:hypothetical protein [Candidatus Saccharibacteria bacterium]